VTERSWNAVSRSLEPPAVQGLLLESLGWNMLKWWKNWKTGSIFALGRSWECGRCRSTAFGVMQNLRLLLYSYSSWQAKCVADERSWNSPDSEEKNPNVNYSVAGYHRYDGYHGHQLFKNHFSEALGSALHATAARHGIGNLDGLGRSWRLETPWNSPWNSF